MPCPCGADTPLDDEEEVCGPCYSMLPSDLQVALRFPRSPGYTDSLAKAIEYLKQHPRQK